MSVFTPVLDPRQRPARSWVVDAVVAVLATGLSLPVAIQSGVAATAAVPVMALVLAPLVLRRVYPVPAFGLGLTAAALGGWWALPAVGFPGLLVGLYTIATTRPRRTAFVAAALLAVGALAASIRLGFDEFWVPLLPLSATIAAALALGLYVATRRALLLELRSRAQQAERERDRQGELAAAAERSRIAREMHDIVAHHLTVMVALSEGAVATAAKSPERAVEVMRTVSATGRQALSDTRRLLGVLRDDADDADDAGQRAPLPDLSDLDDLLLRVREAGLPVRYEVRGASPDVPPAVQLTLYRLIQEALTNTMKHAGRGAEASVTLHYAADAVSVEVRDDGGVAAAGAPPPGAGRGLAGMRERVRAVGGEVWTGPVDSRGWQVRATMTLAEAAS